MTAVGFRFDIDTHVCLQQGVPALLDLAEELGVAFTFFINMGRAVDQGHVLSHQVSRSRAMTVSAAKLPPRRKLGLTGYTIAALLNPAVGQSSPRRLRAIIDAGHELGLHGGRNHGTWQYAADGWSRQRLASEVDWGIEAFEAAAGRRPLGFASPGWNHPSGLLEILKEQGFRYVADEHGTERGSLQWATELPHQTPLATVPTDLTGEPGGVGYFEHRVALGESPEAIVEHARTTVAQAPSLAIVYDHPSFAGKAALPLIRASIQAIRDDGHQIARIDHMVETWTNAHPSSS